MIKQLSTLMFGVFLLFGCPSISIAQDEPILDGIGQGRPLVIEGSPGGDVYDFLRVGLKLQAAGTPIILDGVCASACTLLIDVDRKNVCITSKAILLYHKMTETDEDGHKTFHPLNYETPGLNAYIASRGGLPDPDQELMMVPYEQALKFYKACPGAP